MRGVKQILKKIIRLFIPFKIRVWFFWKYNTLKNILTATYSLRTDEDLSMAKKFNAFIDNISPKEKFDTINNLSKNLDDKSLLEIKNFITRNKYIAENNFLKINEYFSEQEKKEQRQCSIDSRATRKKLKKYQLTKYNPESFFGLNGLKWLPEKIKEQLNAGVFLDVGAYDGDSALAFLLNFNPDKIYSFEPEKNNFIKLNKNKDIAQNNIIIPIKKGVSDYNGYAKISDEKNGSKITQDNLGEEVEITTIDSFCEQNRLSNIKLIKMDIEGEEMKALKGAHTTILKNKPILAISIYHNYQDFFFIKPWIENINKNYKFIIKKAHPFTLVHETMLICYCE